ncbi:DHA2 family efflux MFS transporter permease subunit [Lentzea sp. NPDC005914]|uniref:DHA2 family efflux MFS transporter permease subunit n=1 Tax=Lentzea sp. NPDC005914 TaxID=3154572 RepID=UPI0033E0878B
MQKTERLPQRWAILAVLCLALLVVVLDNTVLNVAVPSLSAGLGASTSDIQWMINAYSLVMAGLLLAAGSLSDRYGRKRALMFGLALFGIGSLVATFAGSPTQLIIARAVMGVGAAFLTPGTLAVLVRVFDNEERAKAIGIWAAVSSLGIAAGPVVGGFLLAHFWWGSVFAVNVPIAVIGFIAVAALVPESKDPVGKYPDILGGVLSAASMAALIYAVISGSEHGWTDSRVLATFAAGVVLLVVFIWWQRKTDNPMLELSMFANPRFNGAAAGGVLAAFGMGGSLFLLTQHLQFVLRFSPLEAGFRIAPLAISVLISSSLLSARVGKVLGQGPTMTLGMTVASGGLAVIALVDPSNGYLPTFCGLVLIGFGVGLAMPVAAHAMMSAIPLERAGTGSGINQTLQEIGASFGVAVLGAVLTSKFIGGLPADLGEDAGRSLPAALSAAAGNPETAAAARDAFAAGMSSSQLIGALAVLCGGLLAGFLLRRAEKSQPVPQHA